MENFDLHLLKEGYSHDGYAVIPAFLGKDEITALISALGTTIREGIPLMPTNHVVYEDPTDKDSLKLMQDLHLYNVYFSELLFRSKFQTLAETLMDEPVIGKTVEYFNKPPKIGKATPVHQDGHYFMLSPPLAITMWLAMEDVDEENGCVRYVKGSHLKPLRPHGRTNTAGFSQGIIDYGSADDNANEIPIHAKAGDLLIHHALTIHRADANASATRSRRALGLIYFAASAREDKAAKEAYLKTLSIKE